MRIIHILDHSIPLHSGYTFRTLSILREQRALGWETFHVTSAKQGSGDLLEEHVDGLQFFRTPVANGPLAKLPVLNQVSVIDGLTRRLLKLIPRVNPDVLHAHSPSLNAIAALRAGAQLGIPVVYEVRALWEDAAVDHGTGKEFGIRYRLSRSLETYALKRADAITTICEGLRNEIIARGIPTEKVNVIPNAVDVSRFHPGGEPDKALKQALGIGERRVIGFIGSFYAYEGLDILLEAVPRIVESDPDVCVLLIGGGPDEARLLSMVNELGIQDKVVFPGRVPHGDVQKYYDLIDILVYPRKSMRLTNLVTPLKPLEAMAQKRLIVASDVGGHLELIRDGKNGVLFRAGDPRSLAAKVSALLREQEKWLGLRSEGRRFVESERNWRASVSRYQNVYGGLLGVPAV